MKHRFAALLALFVLALTLTGSAFAFDCIRVSSSAQGMQQSAASSGKWLYVDMSSTDTVAGVLAGFLNVDVSSLTSNQLSCIASAYAASGAPIRFALGTGVAGGDTNGPGVLALNAPDKVLTNGHGIDHADETVGPALLAAVQACA